MNKIKEENNYIIEEKTLSVGETDIEVRQKIHALTEE